MPTAAEIRAQLTGPGGMFEVTADTVLGREMEVYANRMPSLRALLEGALLRADEQDFIVYGDRTYGFATFVRTANGIAHALRRFGVQKGDRCRSCPRTTPSGASPSGRRCSRGPSSSASTAGGRPTRSSTAC